MKPSVLKGFRTSFPWGSDLCRCDPCQDEVRVHGGGATVSAWSQGICDTLGPSRIQQRGDPEPLVVHRDNYLNLNLNYLN